MHYESVPECSYYHPQNALGTRPGYYPNIEGLHLAAANSLRARIVEAGLLERFLDEEPEFLKILRFLRARKFNVDHAFAMVEADIQWRNEDDRSVLHLQTASEVLQCDIMQFYRFFPTWIQGIDKQNRPVSYRKFGKFEIWNVLKLTTMERLLRFHAWETEMAIRKMRMQSRCTEFNIETFTCVIDSAGWSMKLATSDAFTFIKGMANVDSDHYPERLGSLIVINAPSMLAMAWRVIQNFLDDVQKSKIQIFSSNKKDWQPVLFNLVDKSEVPMEFGGDAPDLSPEDALNGMNPEL